MPASRPIDDLRKQAADLILQRRKQFTVKEIASDLKISRQAVYDILKGKYSPSLSLVQAACQKWDEKFTYGSIQIDKQSFPPSTVPQASAAAIQQNLFDVASLTSQNFEVIQTKPMGRALEITLLLRVSHVAAS